MALTDNLVAYWKLEEASGNRADAHGSFTLTDNNTVTSTTGKIGDAARFEKDNSEYLSRATGASLQVFGSAFTFGAWIRISSDSRIPILGHLNGNAAFMLERISAGTGGIQVTMDGFSTFATTNTAIAVDTWTHVVVVFDGSLPGNYGRLKIYLGGAEVAVLYNGTIPASFSAGATDLQLGAATAVVIPTFDGDIDEAFIANRAWTAAEIVEVYNGGDGLSYDDWDAGGGGAAIDSPTITAVDNGDQTATVTLTGGEAGAANVVYYLRYTGAVGAEQWTEFGDRTGAGTIGPVALTPEYYLFKVESTAEGSIVVPDLYALRVAGTEPAVSRSVGDIGDALRHWLMTEQTVSGLVGNRVYPDKVPQREREYPRIVYERMGGSHVAGLQGIGFLAEARFELTCAAMTKEQAKAIAKAIRGTKDAPALDSYRGFMGAHDAVVYVQCARLEDDRDAFAPFDDGTEYGEYQAIVTVNIWFEEVQ